LATFCDHFLASFGDQFGYKIFLHLATLVLSNRIPLICHATTCTGRAICVKHIDWHRRPYSLSGHALHKPQCNEQQSQQAQFSPTQKWHYVAYSRPIQCI